MQPETGLLCLKEHILLQYSHQRWSLLMQVNRKKADLGTFAHRTNKQVWAHQPVPKGGSLKLRPFTVKLAAKNLKLMRASPSGSIDELMMKDPAGGNVMTFCSRALDLSMTCNGKLLKCLW